MRSAHFKPIGIGLANVLTTLMGVYVLHWDWLALGILNITFTYLICFPTKTYRGLKHFWQKILPDFIGRLIEVFTSWEKSLSILAYTLVFFFVFVEMLLLAVIWSGMNPRTTLNSQTSPLLWYEGLFLTTVLLGHVGVIINEVFAKNSDKHSLSNWGKLSSSSNTVWSIWIIILCVPLVGHVISFVLLLPYVVSCSLLVVRGLGLVVGHLFATAYVAWNSREVLVCLGDGFISATLTSVFLVENYQLTGQVLILSAFLVGYGIGVVHFNLLRRLIPVLEPYRIRV